MKFVSGMNILLAAAVGTIAMGADYLPTNSQPLSTVLAKLEQQGLSPIVEASFDDGFWEVEGFRGTRSVEVHVDPATGKIVAERPDQPHTQPSASSLPASAIVKALEGAGYSPVYEIDWKYNSWEAEATNANGQRELQVDPRTGKVTSDRLDD